MNILNQIKSHIPAPIRKRLKSFVRNAKVRSARNRGDIITKDRLIIDLKSMGINNGDILMVHSSLSSMGYVDGGPGTIVDSLFDIVGDTGTILMPVYPIFGDWWEFIQSDPIFDPLNSPSSLGKITDTFWRYPGVKRSLHPTHSVAAIGPSAEYLISDHEKSITPCGNPSPFLKLIELKGRILHLGSPFWSTSSFHVVEDLIDDYPINVYYPEEFKMRVLDPIIGEKHVRVKIHDPEIAQYRIDKNKKIENEIYDYCRKKGIVQTSQVGLATSHLIDAAGLEELLEVLILKGITIYDRKVI